ncbi:hypothetical protein HY523_01385 [Candidatus Berkelbacteria bacterium]|nr:hypothetical protein [Candidatus Berkelbacteria bacterium]
MPEFDLGRVYARAWETFQRGFVWYLVTWLFSGIVSFIFIVFLAIIGIIGLVAVGGLTTLPNDPEQVFATIVGSIGGLTLLLLLIVGMTVISTFTNGTHIELTHQLYQGYQADLLVAFSWARHRFWPYLWTGILFGFATVVAFLLLVIPGIIVTFAWSLALYLVAREGLSGSRTLGRSWHLTSPALGWTMLTLFLYWGGMFVLLLLVSWLPGANALISGVFGLFSLPLLGSLYEELLLIEKGGMESVPDTSALQAKEDSIHDEPTVMAAVTEAPVIPAAVLPKAKPKRTVRASAKKVAQTPRKK